ncbi:LysR substrate-binding domain-containing protein [Pigmentiphaga litoralis]|uniref:LysR family glycine cleavage system transcriptional activator n=1 Tax=Pigmentiphaga litoralis TaxID=516702 RepID=A0A7Y9ISV8_9BURK|nr:LysR substrate-binding domain-containing protein [Pigmentiphaga litoralis]NYE24015.1 LysR family glycine cleavage system transcriptional activator [Pigmentiphaga litoralis]NYE82371.1 LysR family glycine cleavage system transcriptional activator [Pigmentiphaga litoralis]
MANRHPPLNSLKVFEAAARHLSFKKAAEELCVTPGAVSRQLSHLESLIGAPLFRRVNHGIELTAAARLCLPKLQEGLACLRESVEQIFEHTESQTLSVYAAPSFAMRWLMPRLHRFALDHPDIDVQVSTRISPFVGRRGTPQATLDIHAWTDQADVVMMFGDDHLPATTPDLHVEPLMPLSITPMCSPDLLDGAHGMSDPEDVLQHLLLHDNRGLRYGTKSFWRQWLDAAGVSAPNADGGPRFTHSLLALEAAIDGMGVVASTPMLVTDALRTGALVAPFDLQVPLGCAYHLISKPAAYQRNDVALFRNWLHAEVKRSRHDVPRRLPAYA